ncbi:DUF6879 family protein [Phytohabitans kaempferiae]|uniref:DUF6879 family protein n=1 Tax=Phytohabitans kaempferiae TaxID=1620943 RepID=A0ABV6LXD2_9ACTN
MTDFNGSIEDLLAACERSAVHLEMRDGYALDDPVYIDWQAGLPIDPAARWPDWFDAMSATTARGVQVRRARVISEPISAYIRYEYDVTDGLNIASGEEVRWLPRRQASDIALPGNDFWLFDGDLLILNHIGGNGEWLGVEQSTDPATIKLCASAFEAVWERAISHADYRPA